jgi:hypothetical protein
MPIQPLPKPHVELSSDATIPASDVYQPDEEAPEEDRYANAGSAQRILSSPPAHMMQSSPPTPRHVYFDTKIELHTHTCSILRVAI